MLDKSIRELDRERSGLQSQEKKLIAEIKQMAKANQMGAVKARAQPPPNSLFIFYEYECTQPRSAPQGGQRNLMERVADLPGGTDSDPEPQDTPQLTHPRRTPLKRAQTLRPPDPRPNSTKPPAAGAGRKRNLRRRCPPPGEALAGSTASDPAPEPLASSRRRARAANPTHAHRTARAAPRAAPR